MSKHVSGILHLKFNLLGLCSELSGSQRTTPPQC